MNSRLGNLCAASGMMIVPLLNVVLLLLAIFVGGANTNPRVLTKQSDLPARGLVADPLALGTEPVRILLSPANGRACAIEIRGEGVTSSARDFDALRSTLSSLQRDPAESSGLFESNHKVLIIPAAGTFWSDAAEAFNAALDSGYTNIGFAAAGAQ